MRLRFIAVAVATMVVASGGRVASQPRPPVTLDVRSVAAPYGISTDRLAPVGAVVLTVNATSANADGGLRTLQVDFGVPVTARGTVSGVGLFAPVLGPDVNGTTITVNLPICVADPIENLSCTGTLTIRNVRVDLTGAILTNLRATVTADQDSGYIIRPGLEAPVVISTIGPGLADAGITTTPGAIANGVETRAAWELRVTEADIDVLGTRTIPLRIQFTGIPPGVSLTIDRIALEEDGARITTASASPATLTEDRFSTEIRFDPVSDRLPSPQAATTVAIFGVVSIDDAAAIPTGDITAQATLAPDDFGRRPDDRARFETDLRPVAGVTVVDVSSIGSLEIVDLPDTVSGLESRSFGVRLGAPTTVPLDGEIEISFTPAVALPRDDPGLRFSAGGRTAAFTVPEGGTMAEGLSQLMTGTVGGIITLTARAGRTTVTRSVEVRRTGSGFNIHVVGFSTAVEVAQAMFRFQGTNLGASPLRPTSKRCFSTGIRRGLQRNSEACSSTYSQ